MFRRFGRLITCLLAASACVASNGPASPDSTLASGTWGGQHIKFLVTDTAATVEFDCAHGRIEGAVPLDASGRFDVVGTFALERGGPARPGEVAETRRARYTGSTSGSAMNLNVSVMDPAEDVGTFSLTQGEAGRLVKCL